LTTSGQKQLKQLHHDLYEKALAEARNLPSLSNPSIIKYAADFSAGLPTSFSKCKLGTLVEQILRSQIVLYGDFHTLAQSQRGLLRILRALVAKGKSSQMVVALEMLRHHDQQAIDEFLGQMISEEDFLLRIDYQHFWGFPWINYRVIFDLCRNHHIKIIGINSLNGGRDSLETRDRFASGVIRRHLAEHPGQRILCLVGEYHLAEQHLPKYLRLAGTEEARAGRAGTEEAKGSGGQGPRILKIFNNIDQYYFDLEHDLSGLNTEYLRLSDDSFCVLNTPPWIKWLSLTMWEELQEQHDVDWLDEQDEDDTYTESSFDYDYTILSFAKKIAEFLAIQPKEAILDHCSILSFPDFDDYLLLKSSLNIPDDYFESILERANIDGAYMLSQANQIIITKLSLNNLAECAGQFLQRMQSHFNDHAENACEAFYRRCLKFAAGMFASKVINPRRKAYDVGFYKGYLQRMQGRKLQGFAHQRKKTVTAIMRHDQWLRRILTEGRSIGKGLPALYDLDKQLHFEVSRAVGNLVGYRLYLKFIQRDLASDIIADLYQRDLSESEVVFEQFKKIYRAII